MKNCLLILRTFIANKQIGLKYILIFFGIIFYSIAHGQTKTDAELYATWKDKSNSEIKRLEAIWERVDIHSLPNKEPIWWKKWKKEINEAIELAIKNNKKGYLPLFYMFTMEDCADNTECMCTNAHKAIESAKVANASKLPIVFFAYYILTFQCNENVNEEDMTYELNKMKSFLSDSPVDLKNLRETISVLGEWYSRGEKYPKALNYLLESQRLSEKLKLMDLPYAQNNERLAGIHSQIGNYKEAEKYIDKSLQVAHSLKDTLELGSSYLGKSNLMLKFTSVRL
jgi:tetratricopeptide (TPR) repeat protein